MKRALIIKPAFLIFLGTVFFLGPIGSSFAEYLVLGPTTAMIHKRGLLLDSLVPNVVDGLFIKGRHEEFPLPERILDEDAKYVEPLGGTCRIYSRNLKNYVFFKKIEEYEYIYHDLSHPDSYIVFKCKEL